MTLGIVEKKDTRFEMRRVRGARVWKLVLLLALLALAAGFATAETTDAPQRSIVKPITDKYYVYNNEYVPLGGATVPRQRLTIKGKPAKASLRKPGFSPIAKEKWDDIFSDGFDQVPGNGTAGGAAQACEERRARFARSGPWKRRRLERIEDVVVLHDVTWKVRIGKTLRNIVSRLTSNAQSVAGVLLGTKTTTSPACNEKSHW